MTPQPSNAPLLPSLLTFQHLHSHGDRLGSTVLVNANSFCHDHLSKAAFSKRLTKCQPDHGNRGGQCVPSTSALMGHIPLYLRNPRGICS